MVQESTIGSLKLEGYQPVYTRGSDGLDWMKVSDEFHIRAHRVFGDNGFYWASLPGSKPTRFDPDEVVRVLEIAMEEVA
jgi:hypothetical protein